MEIRRARPDDVSGISQIEHECFSDPWSEKDLFGYVTTEGGMCFVACDGGAVIAYLIGRIIPPEGEIYRIAVHPSHRRRGIGYRLLDYSRKTVYGRGLETLFLEVRSKNTPARSLYRAYGFRELGIRRGYYKDPDDDAVVMLYGKLNTE